MQPIELCNKCTRVSHCVYPCEAFSLLVDQKMKKNQDSEMDGIVKRRKQEKNRDNERCNPHKNTVSLDSGINDIKAFLNYNVEDEEWLQVLNGLKTIEIMIDTDELFMYMDASNKDYCNEHNLCEKCRSELVEVRDQQGEHFGRPVFEKIWICPVCRE